MKSGGAGTVAQNQFIANHQPYHSDRITRVCPSDSDQVKWATFEVPNKGCGGRM